VILLSAGATLVFGQVSDLNKLTQILRTADAISGSQQFTARNLYFTQSLTAVSMIWDWGFTWNNITVESVMTAFDCSLFGGDDGQGTGSISIIGKLICHSLFEAPVVERMLISL
jgi:hypothetical protein